MRALSRRGAERPGRSPAARGTATAVCRPTALRYATWLKRGQSCGVDEAGRRQSVGRRHHRDFLISRLAASAVRITPPAHLPLEGGGRPAPAGRVGVTAVPQNLTWVSRWHRRHPTPDCLRQSDPPPSGEGETLLVGLRRSLAGFAAPIRTRSERPGAVSADVDGRGRVGAVRLLGRRLGAEGRARLEVVLAAKGVAHDMRVRRDDDPLLALRVLDHDAWIAAAGERRANRNDRLDKAVRHGAIGRAVPPLIKMAP